MHPARILSTFAVLLSLASFAHATVIWNDSVNGNLSSSPTSPTPLTLSLGTNSIIGNVGGGSHTADWVALTVPSGLQLSSDVLANYASTDSQGFTGVQASSSFVGNPETSASAYLGYVHFGTGVTNGSLPRTSNVGDDLLALMGQNSTYSPGSQGFTPPLPSGTYTFLFQQLGASTDYQFDFGVTSVPEPGALAFFGVIGMPLIFGRRLCRPLVI